MYPKPQGWTAALTVPSLLALTACQLSACQDAPNDPRAPSAHAVAPVPEGQKAMPTIAAEAAHSPSAEAAHNPNAHAQPPSYYALPGLDHGLLQSPVNILTSDTVGSAAHRIKFAPPPHGLASIENTGHTVRLAFPRGGVLRFDDRDYETLQVHFHTPSEHQVDGVTYPMEMHVVSRRSRPDRPGQVPEYAVLAVLFKMGRSNAFIDEFIEQVPNHSGDRRALAPDSVDLHDCFDLDSHNHYYHYRGSLTTPPYTESVDWLVLQEVVDASPEQIARINLVEGNNARHVQALYRRHVELN